MFSRHSRPQPLLMRGFFVLALLIGSALTWFAYYFSQRAVDQRTVQRHWEHVQLDAVTLEDHASRSLDTAVNLMRLAASLTTPDLLSDPQRGSATLVDLAADSPVIRSLSLVDSSGKVVLSSVRRNVGVQVPPEHVKLDSRWTGVFEFHFGRSFALRDLYEFEGDRTPVDLGFLLIEAPVDIGGTTYHWIAAVNLGVFLNLWDQLGQPEVSQIHIVGENGELLASQAAQTQGLRDALPRVLADRVDTPQADFVAGEDDRTLVTYRSSDLYPLSIVITTERNRLLQDNENPRGGLPMVTIVALVANLLLIVFLAVLFAMYRRYERSLQELANQSHAVDLHLMVSETSSNGTILGGNTAFFAANGYAPEELIGQTYRALTTEIPGQGSLETAFETLRTGRAWRGTLQNRRKSGDLYWVSATIVPFPDVWGRTARYVTLMTDISESILLSARVANEQRLREDLTALNQSLVTEATTDPLTGRPNKRAFDLFMPKAVDISKDDQKPLSVMMLDIDHFKQINDTYGHLAGDAVLREVAIRWEREIRGSDMLARLGGEEFCVVLPRTTTEQTRRLAEKICRLTAAVTIDFENSPGEILSIPVTVSIGVSTADPADAVSTEQLMHSADEALYEAKRSGRNRVVVAGGSMAT
ncbi:MAG: sensor domain-containing diguanylate cyclase [Steroidobacteraceae bacterium]